MKVHFANYSSFPYAIDAAGVNYVLESYYHLRDYSRLPELISMMNSKKHSILDSGLFTLMFGAEKDSNLDADFFRNYQEQYVEWILKNGYTGTVVEIDCQKKAGPQIAWELRRKLRTQIPNKILNVFHMEDKNPDALIEFSDYIAISIPELKHMGFPRKEILNIVSYFSRKTNEKGKQVHLLGCTDNKIICNFKHLFSCDSISWCSSTYFNAGKSTDTGSYDVSALNADFKYNDNEKHKKSRRRTLYQARIMLSEYEKIAGDQS